MASFGTVILGVICCFVIVNATAPKVPNFKVNGKDAGIGKIMLIISPKQSYTIEAFIKGGKDSPLSEKGTLYVYKNGIEVEPKIHLTDSPTDNTTDLTATYTLEVTETASFNFVTLHPDIPDKKRETALVLEPGDFDLAVRAIARPYKTSPIVIKIALSLGGTAQDPNCTWHQKNESTDVWEVIPAETSCQQLKLTDMEPGNYTYKLNVVQTKVFNIHRDSHPVHVLVFVQMSDIDILSPTPNVTKVSTPLGKEVTFTCTAKGYPEPEYQWIKFADGELKNFRKGQKLTIGSSEADSGKYKCAAIQPRFEQRVIRQPKAVVELSFT